MQDAMHCLVAIKLACTDVCSTCTLYLLEYRPHSSCFLALLFPLQHGTYCVQNQPLRQMHMPQVNIEECHTGARLHAQAWQILDKPAAATSIESFRPPANQPNKLPQHRILAGETAAGRNWSIHQLVNGRRSGQVGTSARGCTTAYKTHKRLMHP